MLAREQRQRIVDLCMSLSHRGFLSGTGGNVALRLDAERIVVTPSATDYFAMTAADVCVLRLSDLARIEGDKAPTVEAALHAGVLHRRPDVNCSIHTHQPIASSCTLLGKPLTVTDPAARAVIGSRVPLVGYFPSGTKPLAWLLSRALRPDTNAYLMRNHGVLCCGATIEAAVDAVERLEEQALKLLRQRISARLSADPAAAALLRPLLGAP